MTDSLEEPFVAHPDLLRRRKGGGGGGGKKKKKEQLFLSFTSKNLHSVAEVKE